MSIFRIKKKLDPKILLKTLAISVQNFIINTFARAGPEKLRQLFIIWDFNLIGSLHYKR